MIREATPDDVAHVLERCRDRDRRSFLSAAGVNDPQVWAHSLLNHTSAWTLVSDGPVAVGGFRWRLRTAEGFLVATDEFPRHWRRLYRLALMAKQEVRAMAEIHRIQAVCLSDDPEAARFLRHLGLECEAVLRKAGYHGENFVVYSEVW